MMNQIPIRQNEPTQIERLAAQRELYSAAKRWQVIQLLASVIIPIILSVWAWRNPEIADWAAIIGGLMAVVEATLFDYLISGYREKAAKIQELFDCYVLELQCSPLHNPEDVTNDEIATYYNKHKRKPENLEKLIDWYSIAVGALPIHLARLVCQLSNCSWDSELRRRYSNLAAQVLVGVMVLLLAVGLLFKESFKDFLLMAFIFAPFITYCFKQYKEQRDASKRQKELVVCAKSIWSSSITKGTKMLLQESRQLQNAIFEARSKNPTILDTFYNRLKDEQEATMYRTASDLAAEAQQRLAKM
jgi:hypothetical protein